MRTPFPSLTRCCRHSTSRRATRTRAPSSRNSRTIASSGAECDDAANLGVWKASANDAVGQSSALTPALSVPNQSSVAPPETAAEKAPTLEPNTGTDDSARVTRRPGKRQPPRPPQWWDTQAIALSPASLSTHIALPPLLAARIDRAIVAAALGTHVEEGDVDLDRLITVVAAGLPIQSVPRQAVTDTAARRASACRCGSGDGPVPQDINYLIERLRAIAPSDLLTIEPFLGCPSRGDDAVSSLRAGWAPPPRGTPVIVVTDLGIGGPLHGRDRATQEEWLVFARSVRLAGHPLIGFIPYEPRRWPSRLARTMTLLHWSERTRIGSVKRAMREASRVRL